MRRRRAPRSAWIGVAVLLLAPACARIPDEGPVVDGSAPDVVASAAPFHFSPPGPETGATPEQVVSGFLTALQATPLSTTVARQFLTDRAVEEWQPERATLLYAEQDVEPPPVQSGREPVAVPVTLRRVFALDDTGRWAGRQREVEQSGLRLSVVRERGEWRVADPPDAMVLPLTHFENRYARFAVFFADPSGSVLVPEPVYLPQEGQTATQLVEALLAGPRGAERRVDRSFVPPRSELVVSVPVDATGVARVPLTGELLDLGRRDLKLAAAQLVWTLRQVPEVTAVRLIADGEPVAVPGIGEQVPVGALAQYDPLGAGASTDLYGLRQSRVRRVTAGVESTVIEIPGGIRPVSLGVGLSGDPLAVADADGGVHVLMRGADRRGSGELARKLTPGPVTKPLWDWSRALWLVPRRFDRQVRLLAGGRARALRWPGSLPVGRVVDAATISRDGSRLVLAVSRPGGGSELVLARVVRSAAAGAPLALSDPRSVPTGSRLPRVADLEWRDEQTLAVLTRAGGLGSRVLAVPVDGQRQSRTLSDDSDVLFGSARTLAASPATGEVRVTTRRGEVVVLLSQGRWQEVAVGRRPLRAATFVG